MQDAPRTTTSSARWPAFLEERLAFAVAAGIRTRIASASIPGIGFGKTPDQNLELLRGSARSSRSGGRCSSASRARARSGKVLGDPTRRSGTARRPSAPPSAAFDRGASIFRAHDVRPHVDALAVAAAVERGRMAA